MCVGGGDGRVVAQMQKHNGGEQDIPEIVPELVFGMKRFFTSCVFHRFGKY